MAAPVSIEDLTRRLAEVAGEATDARLGLYLHGSHSRGEAGPRSDLDVLGLCVPAADDADLRARCLDAGSPWRELLDLKIVPADEFAANPWVDLRRARLLVGHPWHESLPERTPDQAGRESLLVLAVLFEDQAFAQREVGEVGKPVGRLCSVLAALISEVVPQSAGEALGLLDDGHVSAELRAVAGQLGRLPDDADVPPELSARIRQVAGAVADVLRDHVERGRLGPTCTEAATRALAMRDRYGLGEAPAPSPG